jgi:MOSC domain-containing protein YiiM
VAVCVGRPAAHEWLGKLVRTAIFKEPAAGRVAARGGNLEGDEQAFAAHGGPDKAVYAYAAEDSAWWAAQVGRSLEPGAFGENLTLRGVDVTGAAVGERWRVGDALLEVREPRLPCLKLGLRLGDRRLPPRFARAGRPGAYLAIVEEGDLGAGDAVTVAHRPAHGVTVGLVAQAYHRDRGLAPRLLDARELPAGWRRWAEGIMA